MKTYTIDIDLGLFNSRLSKKLFPEIKEEVIELAKAGCSKVVQDYEIYFGPF